MHISLNRQLYIIGWINKLDFILKCVNDVMLDYVFIHTQYGIILIGESLRVRMHFVMNSCKWIYSAHNVEMVRSLRGSYTADL